MVTLSDYEAFKRKQSSNEAGAAGVVLAQDFGGTPDAAAADLTLAAEHAQLTGAPAAPSSLVKEYRSTFQANADALKASTVLSSSPTLSAWLREPDNAAVARDDLSNLSWFEQQGRGAVNALDRGMKQIEVGFNQGAANSMAQRNSDRSSSFGEILADERTRSVDGLALIFAGWRQTTAMLDSAFGNDTAGKAAAYQQRAAEVSAKIAAIPKTENAAAIDDWMAAMDWTSPDAVSNILQNVALNPIGFVEWISQVGLEVTPQLVAATAATVITRNPTTGAMVFGGSSVVTNTGAQSLEFVQEAGYDLTTPKGAMAAIKDKALMSDAYSRGAAYGLVVGAIDTLSGGLASVSLADSQLANLFLQTMLQGGLAGVGEAGGQVAAGMPIDPGSIFAEMLGELGSAPAEVMGVGGKAFLGRQEKAKAAADRVAMFKELSGQAVSSKLRERMPDKFRQFIERATANGPVENVFIPADKFVEYFQGQGIDPAEMAATLKGVTAADLETAIETGGDLKIPTASYATVMAGSPHDPFMVENMKLSPDDMTVTEAMEFNDKAQDAMQEAWELAEAVRRDEETYRAVETQIYDEMVGRLRTAGRSTDVAGTEALLYPAFYRTMAERSGMAIEDFLAKHPLPQVRGAAPAGMQLRDADALTRTLTEARARRTAGLDTGQSLLEFISERGGILDPGGELKARDASVVKRGRGKKTLRLERRGVAAAVGDMLGGRSAGGHGFDDVARAAIEAGFMADDPTVLAYQQAQRDGTEVPDIGRALLDAIDRELRGETVAAAPVDGLDQIEEYLAGLGVSLDDDDASIRQAMEEGERKYGQGAAPTDAYASAKANLDAVRAEFDAMDRKAKFSKNGEADRYFELSGKLSDAKEALAAVIADMPGAVVLRHRTDEKRGAMITRSMDAGATWRVTYFDERGFSGDAPRPDKLGAATEAVNDGFEVLAPNMLREFSIMPSFAEGNEIPERIRQENARSYNQSEPEHPRWSGDGKDPTKWEGDALSWKLNDTEKRWLAGTDDADQFLTDGGELILGAAEVEQFAELVRENEAAQGRGSVPLRFRTYFQADMQAPGGGSMRGQIAFGDAEAIVTLFQSADLSTFVHESGHFFLEALRLINTEEWSTVAEYLGVGPDGVLTVEQHEKFASEFEAYAMSGKAPSLGLRAAFEKFRAWLLSIYRKARGLNVEVSPELRTVFDRMLATDAEILAAQRETAPDVAVTADDLGMTAEQFAAFQKLRTQAKDEAAAKLLAETMAPIKRAATEAYKNERKAVRQITEKRLRDMPMFRAVQELRFGRDFDGNDIQPVKLDRAAIERDYGAGWLPQLPGSTKDGKGHRNAVFAHEGGMHPDIVAGMYGYQSGGQLLDALAKAPAIDDAIDAETDRIMRERHSDPLTDGSVQQLALDAVHGDKRGEALAAELRALNEVAGLDRGLTVKEARETARRTLRTMRVRDASAAHRFLAAERKAGQEAMRLTATVTREGMWLDRARRLVETKARAAVREADAKAAAGITTDAANATTGRFNEDAAALVEAKRRQLLNHMLYAESLKIAASVDALVTKSSKLNKSDARLSKARNVDYVRAARAIAAKFGLARAESDFDFAVWIEQLRSDDAVTADALTSAIETYGQDAKAFKDLTVGELGALADAIESIMEIGKRARLLEIDGKSVERELAISELRDVLDQRPQQANAALSAKLSKASKFKIGALSILSSLRRMETWSRDMDDGKAGVFTRYLVKPVMDAVGVYRMDKAARLTTLLDIINPRKADLLGKAISAPELGYTFENKGEFLHALLHTGNESNLEKLLMGRGWSSGLTGQKQRTTAGGKPSIDRQGNPLMTRGRVDTSKWDALVKRMIAEGTLTKADYETAQAIWDLMEAIKRPAQSAHRRVYGYYFNEVEAAPLVTPFGTFRGGYVPAIADADASNDGQIRADQAAHEAQQTSFMFPTTGAGFTKSRVAAYTTPLSLNLMLLPAHMDKVLRFTHLNPVIRQTASLVTSGELRNAIDAVDKTIIPNLITPWLQRTAQQAVEAQPTTPAGRAISNVFRTLRKRVGVHTMFLNLVNTAQQITGLSSAAVLVKPSRLKSALVRFTKGDAALMREEASAASVFMRDRIENAGREITGRIQEAIIKPTAMSGVEGFVNKHGYVLQQGAQNVVDVITWHAAYDQAVAAGMSPDDAVFEADSVIRRTMGDFSPENLSGAETGTAFSRLFTMFYSYFNGQANLVGGEMQTAMRTMGWEGAGRMFFIYMFGIGIPAIVGTAIVKAAGGGLDDDEDDGYLDELAELFFGSQFQYVTGMVPGGTLVNSVVNRFNGQFYDDKLSLSPVASAVEKAAGAPNSIKEAFTGEGSVKKAVTDSMAALGLITGIPMGQLSKMAGYGVGVLEGSSTPENLVQVMQGLASGRDGTEN